MYEDLITTGLIGGVTALVDYLSAHVLTCLIPAFFIAGAMNALLNKDSITRYLGEKSPAYKAYPIAVAGGLLLAVCSCTILPLFAGIKKKGAGIGPAIAFLYTAPATNILAVVIHLERHRGGLRHRPYRTLDHVCDHDRSHHLDALCRDDPLTHPAPIGCACSPAQRRRAERARSMLSCSSRPWSRSSLSAPGLSSWRTSWSRSRSGLSSSPALILLIIFEAMTVVQQG